MSVDSQEIDLLSRIQLLEDIEAIRRLKFRYAGLCDAGFDAVELATLFTDDAVWEAGEPWGNYVGPKAIGDFFRATPDSISFAVHALSNGEIDVDGDSAKARWRTLIPCSVIEEKGSKLAKTKNKYTRHSTGRPAAIYLTQSARTVLRISAGFSRFGLTDRLLT